VSHQRNRDDIRREDSRGPRPYGPKGQRPMSLRSLDELREALRQERDPERLAELLSELYEAMDEYSMDASEAAWSALAAARKLQDP